VSNVGSVSVDVVGDVSRFGSRLRTDILPEADRVGREIGKSLAESIAKGIKSGIGEGFTGAPAESARRGAESGGAFAEAFRSKLAAALKALPQADITADSSDADRKIAALRARLQELSDKRVGIDISDAEARAKVASLREELVKLGNSSPSVQVRTDLAKAVLELGAFEALVKKVDGKRIDVKADADTAGAKTKLGELGSAANSAAGALGGPLIAAGIALAPAIIPVAAAVTAAIAGIATAAVGAAAGFGVVVLALKPIIGAVQALAAADASAATDAAAAASAAKAKANAIENATAQVASSETSLANARASAASAAVNAAERVKTAETALGNTRDTVAAAAVNAAQRVGDAQRSLADAQTQAAQGVQTALGQVKASEIALGNTRATVAAAAISAAQRVGDAQRGLADAQTQAAQGVQTALGQVTSAERTLAQAQQSELTAQQALTDARKSAAQQLQDYQTQLADGALSQRAALLSIQSARENLNKVNASGASTQLQRDEAKLAYDQAVQHNTDLGIQQQRLQASAAAAAKAGVEGSQQVVAAKTAVSTADQNIKIAQDALAKAEAAVAAARAKGDEQVAKAQEAVATAQRAQVEQARQGAAQIAASEQSVAVARAGVVAAQVKGAEQIAKAQEAVATAQRAQVEQQRQGAAQIIAAQEAIASAQRAQADQARQGAASIAAAQASVAAAQRALADAYERTSSAGVSSADKVAKAFANLTPAGQEFAKFIYGLKDSLKGLSGAAQTGLLPGLQEAIRGLLPALPGLTKFVGDLAKVMGDLFVQASKALTGPFWTQFFSFIGGSAAGWLKTFGETFGNLIKGAAGLFQALAPVGDLFNTSLLKGSKAFADWATNLGTNTGFQKFLGYIRDNLPAVGGLLRDLVKAFENIVVALAPFGPKIVDGVDRLLKLIADIDPKKLGTAIEGFAGISVGLKGLGPALDVLDTAFAKSKIGRVTEAILALGAASVYAYEKWPAFKKIADEAGQTLSDLGKDTSGKGLGTTVFDLFVQRLTDTGTQIRAKVYEINDMIRDKIFTVNDAIRDKIIAVNDAIVGKIYAVNDAIRDKILSVNDAIRDKIFSVGDATRNKVYEVNDAIRDKVYEANDKIRNKIIEVGDANRAKVIESNDAIRDKIFEVNDAIRDFLLARWADIRRNASEWWAGIVADITGIWERFVRGFQKSVSDVGTFLSGAWEGIKTGASEMWGQIVGGIGGIWNTVIDKIKGPLNTILDFIEKHFVQPLNAMLGAVGINPKDFSIPDIPQFSSGGLANSVTGGYAVGGTVGGYSPHDRADNIPAWLTAEEFILPVAATRALRADGGDALLERLRTWDIAGHADGGLVRGYADGGSVWDAITSGFGLGGSLSGTTLGQVATAVAGDPLGAIKSFVSSLLSGIGGAASGVFPELAKGAMGKVGGGLAAKVQSLLAALAPPAIAGSQQAADGALTQGAPGSASAAAAVAYAMSQVGTAGWYRRCLAFVNAAWGHQIPWMGTPMASDSWAAAPSKHYGDTNPPAGAALYYRTGSPAGHVDLSLGGNSIASTDLPTIDRLGVVGFNTPMSQWGANYLGWAMPGYAAGGPVQPVVKPILLDSGGVVPQGLFLGENRTGGPERLDRADQFSGPVVVTVIDRDGSFVDRMRGEIARADRASQLTAAAGSSVAIR